MIYVILDKLTGFVKIGFSDSPWKRLAQVRVSCAGDLVMRAVTPGDMAAERALHSRFRQHHHRGEWFRVEGELDEWLRSFATPVAPKRRLYARTETLTPLDAWMLESGTSNSELCARLRLSPAHVSMLRTGKRQPALEIAVQLIDLTGLDARDFLTASADAPLRSAA